VGPAKRFSGLNVGETERTRGTLRRGGVREGAIGNHTKSRDKTKTGIEIAVTASKREEKATRGKWVSSGKKPSRNGGGKIEAEKRCRS